MAQRGSSRAEDSAHGQERAHKHFFNRCAYTATATGSMHTSLISSRQFGRAHLQRWGRRQDRISPWFLLVLSGHHLLGYHCRQASLWHLQSAVCDTSKTVILLPARCSERTGLGVTGQPLLRVYPLPCALHSDCQSHVATEALYIIFILTSRTDKKFNDR